jgi:hypothetical protein
MIRRVSCLIVLGCASVAGLHGSQVAAQQRQAAQEEADVDVDLLTSQHLKAIAWAMHAYAEKNDNMLPPAAVDNPALPARKRLSGLVLLLPYFDVKPDYLDDATWNEMRINPAQAAAAKKLYQSIDLKKSWDDPAHEKAAKTLVPSFLSPGQPMQRDAQGLAVTHFAFVRGYAGNGDGAFPVGKTIAIYDPENKKDQIRDGSSNTLAVGQVSDSPGPWIAAGYSTSRHLYHPTERGDLPSFGSRHKEACFFALCDASISFIDLRRSTAAGLAAITTRAAGDGGLLEGNVRSYRTVDAWREATE